MSSLELGDEGGVPARRIEVEAQQRRLGVVRLGDRREHPGGGAPRAALGSGSTSVTARPRCAHRQRDASADHPGADDDDIAGGVSCSLAPALPGSGSTVGCCPLSSPRGELPCSAHPTLAACRPDALADARLYLCTDSRAAQGDLEQFLDAVLAAGSTSSSCGEKGLEAREEIRLLEIFAAAAQRHGRLFAVNDRADIARAVGARRSCISARTTCRCRWRARSSGRTCSSAGPRTPRPRPTPPRDEAGVGYYCAGPVWATPTKPGRPAAGLELIEYAARRQDRPAVVRDRRHRVAAAAATRSLAAGARRVVVVRAITEAEDPGAAAAAFAQWLRSRH